MPSSAQIAFNAGEWSPYLLDRIDLKDYARACLTLENFILTQYGAARRRPGFEYIAAQKHSTKECRLLKFQFSTTTTFILEVGEQYIRFFSNRAQVVSGATPVEVSTPYLEAELKDIQTAQVNDEMRFVHPDHPPYILKRITDTSWTFEEIEYTQPPLRDENLDETKTIATSATTGTGITLTASGFTFDSDVVGGYYRIGHDREDASVKIGINFANNDTASSALAIKGDWEIYTSGSWSGRVTVQRSLNGGAWINLRSWSATHDRNISDSGTETEDGVRLRIFISDMSSGSNQANTFATLEAVNATDYGVVKVTAVAGGGATATANVVRDLLDTAATFQWSEGAWSDARGFPRSIASHQSRLYFGGNAAQAQTIWASDVDDFDRFTEEDIQDSDSFRLTIGSTQFDAIQWILPSSKNLLIGTVGTAWSLSSGDEANLITGLTARVYPELGIGSEHIQPIKVENVALFVALGQRRLIEFVYSFEQDGFIAADLTDLGEHVTKGGIKHLAYQSTRDSVVWAVTGDGVLIGLSYVRQQNVVGWHRHTTEGTFESVAVISTGDEEEEIWCSVKRTVNGSTVRYIESMYPDMWRAQEDATYPTDLVYVDSALISESAAQTSVAVAHLVGEDVDILEDGATVPTQTVPASTNVTMVNAADKVIVGLPFTSTLEPMPLEVASDSGTSQGMHKRIQSVIASVFNTSTFKMGPSGSRLDIIYARDTEDPLDTPPPLLTARPKRVVPSEWSRKTVIRLVQDQPLPLTVLSLVRNYELGGPE